MADGQQNVIFQSDLAQNQDIATVKNTITSQNAAYADDILQQAFEEATEGLNDSTVQYSTENGEEIADNTHLTDSTGNFITAVGPDGTTYRFMTTGDAADLSNEQLTEAIQQVIAGSATQVIENQPEEETLITTDAQQIVVQEDESTADGQVTLQYDEGATLDTVQEAVNTETSVVEHGPVQQEFTSQLEIVPPQVSAETTQVVESVTSNIKDGSAPLGSSKNPIRIIQQGSQYTSLQQLTPDQLQQIMQVVQQQQLAKKAKEEGGSSVLYNPQTQTRIVYKVLYPSELHKKNENSKMSSGPIQVKVLTDSVTVPSQKRPYRKRKLNEEEDEEKIDIPELTQEEKDQRKKAKARTRSGRVSKPPKHMVQDYKHIHLVDWDEDLDDSDGGYSDYKVSSEENSDEDDDKENDKEDEEPTRTELQELNLLQDKAYKCDTCDKAYVGWRGLGRHYALNPDHGSLPENIKASLASTSVVQTNTSGAAIVSLFAKKVGNSISTVNSTARQSSDAAPVVVKSDTAKSRPASPSSEHSSAAVHIARPRGRPRGSTTRGPYRGRPRGRPRGTHRGGYGSSAGEYLPPDSIGNTTEKRKTKLNNVVGMCTDEELMEIVLPRIAKTVSAWEFLLMKADTRKGERHHQLHHIFSNFKAVHKEMKKACEEKLELSSGVDRTTEGNTTSENGSFFKVPETDRTIAESLGLSVGCYRYKPASPKPVRCYKYTPQASNSATAITTSSILKSSASPLQLTAPPLHSAASESEKTVLKNGQTAIIVQAPLHSTTSTASYNTSVTMPPQSSQGTKVLYVSNSGRGQSVMSLIDRNAINNIVDEKYSALEMTEDIESTFEENASSVASQDNSLEVKNEIGEDNKPDEQSGLEISSVFSMDNADATVVSDVVQEDNTKDECGGATKKSDDIVSSEDNLITATEGQLIMHAGKLMQVQGGELVHVEAFNEMGEQIASVEEAIGSGAVMSTVEEAAMDTVEGTQNATELNQVTDVKTEISTEDGTAMDTGNDSTMGTESSNVATIDTQQVEGAEIQKLESPNIATFSENSNGNVAEFQTENEDMSSQVMMQADADNGIIGQIYQTEDGLILIQNADGTFQVHQSTTTGEDGQMFVNLDQGM